MMVCLLEMTMDSKENVTNNKFIYWVLVESSYMSEGVKRISNFAEVNKTEFYIIGFLN